VFTCVYLCYALCLLLQILFIATLEIKTRNAPTVSSINSLLSQYCRALNFFCKFYVQGGCRNCSLCPSCPMGKGQPSIHLMICSTLIMQQPVAPFRLWPPYIYWTVYLVVGGQMIITRLYKLLTKFDGGDMFLP
jgi:hypothetical protein